MQLFYGLNNKSFCENPQSDSIFFRKMFID